MSFVYRQQGAWFQSQFCPWLAMARIHSFFFFLYSWKTSWGLATENKAERIESSWITHVGPDVKASPVDKWLLWPVKQTGGWGRGSGYGWIRAHRAHRKQIFSLTSAGALVSMASIGEQEVGRWTKKWTKISEDNGRLRHEVKRRRSLLALLPFSFSLSFSLGS